MPRCKRDAHSDTRLWKRTLGLLTLHEQHQLVLVLLLALNGTATLFNAHLMFSLRVDTGDCDNRIRMLQDDF